MSSQGLLFEMVPVYLTDSPQITNNIFAARRRATLYLRHGRLSSEFIKLWYNPFWCLVLDKFKRRGVTLRKGSIVS